MNMEDPHNVKKVDDVEKAHMMAHASTRLRSEAAELRSEGKTREAGYHDSLAEILEDRATSRYDKQKTIHNMQREELDKTLRKADELRNLLVQRERELITQEQNGEQLTNEERQKVVATYLEIIDVIELIKNEQMVRLNQGK